MPNSKHVLVVMDHPNTASLTHAVAAQFAAGVRAAGLTVDLCDLHCDGFDPRWRRDDIDEQATDIATYQARVEASDAVCLVFPLFWYGMPAMMKGWIDRVWTYGWAYDQIEDPDQSLLKDRTGVFLIPAGANPESWAEEGYEEAMRTLFERGMMGYFGLSDKRLHFLGGAHGSDARRRGILDRAYRAGRELLDG